MAFGTAIHYALEHFFKHAKKIGSFGNTDRLLQYFSHAMDLNRSAFTEIQFKKRLEYGTRALEGYYEQYKDTWDTQVRLEYYVWNAHMNGIPITGKIDKIEFMSPSEVNIVDYKTGNFINALKKLKRPSEKDPIGGDYWRQIVFYKILTDADKKESWHMTSGEMDFIEKDSKSGKYQKVRVDITYEDVEFVKAQIQDTYAKIMDHQFTRGCNEENCTWCEFVKQEYKVGTSTHV